jgi:hypothetical protein
MAICNTEKCSRLVSPFSGSGSNRLSLCVEMTVVTKVAVNNYQVIKVEDSALLIPEPAIL